MRAAPLSLLLSLSCAAACGRSPLSTSSPEFARFAPDDASGGPIGRLEALRFGFATDFTGVRICVETGKAHIADAELLLDTRLAYAAWMDATGAGPDCSIIGNTLERGFGHTPYGDHFAHVCALEVVLADGSVLSTGLSCFDQATAAPVYRWGVGPVLDGMRWAYPYRLAQAPARPGDTVTLTVTGPVVRTWHLVAADGGWQFGDEPGSRLAASLTLSTDQAWRLLTNNLPAGRLAALTVSGDAAVTGILLRTRAMIGAPKWA